MPRIKNFLKKNVRNKLTFLLDSQYWPKETIEDYQFNKLRILIDHAYENIPYYKETFDKHDFKPTDLVELKDLNKIPILTKKDIRKNFDRLIDPSVDRDDLTLNSTGGSTGVPLKFYHNQNYLHWADAMRIRNWKYFVGFDENDTEAVLWGDIRDIGKTFNIKKFIKFFIKPDIKLNTFDINVKILLNFFKWFNFIRPRILRGYASSLYFSSEILGDNNFKINPPTSIISSAELLSFKMRKKIEKTFMAKVYNSYGSREVSQIAMECNQGNMHISSENQIVELVANTSLNEKKLNNIIITNLNNFCMPFIRYEIGDVAESLEDMDCLCGRKHKSILGLSGRSNENIIFNNGKVVNGEYFEFLFENIDEVERYQVLYISIKNKLIIKLQSKDNQDKIIEKFKKNLNISIDDVELEFIFNEDFLKTPSGNFKFVWSE